MQAADAVLERDMRPEHLADSELAGYLDADLKPDERRRVEQHIESCGACRANLVEVMRTVSSYEAGSAAVGAAAPSRRSRFGRLAAVGVTAAIAAGVLITVVPRGGLEAPASAPRERDVSPLAKTEGRTAITTILPLRDAQVDRADMTFVWQAADADLYRLLLMNETGEPIWMLETTDTVAVVPSSVSLTSGDFYFWRVDGVVHGISASSGAHRFQVR